jgi:hypothetical protein
MTLSEKRRIIDAWRTAYAEQERRTYDSYTKKAVRDALSHMKALALNEHYELPPITFADVTRMDREIGPELAVARERAAIMNQVRDLLGEIKPRFKQIRFVLLTLMERFEARWEGRSANTP